MDAGLKQRLIGAAVLVALAVIFLPMLVKGPAPDSGVSDLSMRVPDAPDADYRTVDLPLVVPPDNPEEGVLGAPAPLEGGALPMVDTATAAPLGPARASDDDAAEAAGPPSPSPAPAPEAAPATTPESAPATASDTPPATTPAKPTPAKPAAALAPAALPPTTAGGDYAVHFGAFRNEHDAQLIVRQLAGAGLTAYREPFVLDGRQAQRVRLGPYASREAAEAARVRAAQVRDDVSPRVVALDAAVPAAATRPDPPAAASTAARPADAPKTPAASPGPADTPAVADAGFAVQLGAFSNANEATRLRDRLRGLGITAFTDTVATDKGRLTRVKAGPVPTRADAERLKAQVASKAGIDGMVRSHP